MFNQWLEVNTLSTSGISLWYTLMYLSYRSGGDRELSVPVSVLCVRTKLSRSAIYKERNHLRTLGMIDFDTVPGRRNTRYRICSFEERFMSTEMSTTWTQPESTNGEMSTRKTLTEPHPEISAVTVPEMSTTWTQTESTDGEMSTRETLTEPRHGISAVTAPEMSTTWTQTESTDGELSTRKTFTGPHPEISAVTASEMSTTWTQTESANRKMSTRKTLTGPRHGISAVAASEMSTTWTQTEISGEKEAEMSTSWTQNEKLTSTYINKINRDKRGCGGKKRAPVKQQNTFDFTFITDPRWLELVKTWLDYKRSRGERYKSALSVKKFHTMLRNLSRGDPDLAARIIDKSIANNWAGVFEITECTPPLSSGQRIGQIKQPSDEERRRRLLENFGRKENMEDETKNR